MNDTNETPDSENAEIDLSSLSSLDFNPDWAADDAKKISVERSSRPEFRGRPRRDFDRADAPRERRETRDRRGPRPPRREESRSESEAPRAPRFADSDAPRSREGGKPPRRGNDRRRPPSRDGNPPPMRVADVMIYPEDKPFTVLAKAIKNSARTYVLFEIAKIILEKPERFAVVVTPLQKKDKAGKPIPSDKPLPPFYVSVPDGMPFRNEQDAFAHVFKNHIDKFFDVEEVEIEAPKGNFTMIAKCGFTGELLAPPNYHAYQQILRDWHAANFPKMPFEKFMSRVETVKDPEAIAAWSEKMKKRTRFVLKNRKDGEPESFDDAGAAKAFVVASRKNEAVRETKQVRISGTLVEKMPLGPLKANIEREIEFQRKFPLNTANGFRGRLRHLGFFLYKKGPKGITLVCGVKRKFRTPSSVFSDTIQRVFDFLEKNPGTAISELPKKMLGIGAETEAKPEAAPAETETPAPTENAAPAPSADEEALAKELVGTVRWLVTEGYVAEMSDGKLYAHPVMTEAQAKAAEKAEQPLERPEIPSVECPGDDIGGAVPEAPEPLIKVIGSLSAEAAEGAPAETPATEEAAPAPEEKSEPPASEPEA